MKTPKPLIVGGVVAGPLFTVAWLIEGALTEGYDPLRHLISTLVLGELGWLQVANFLISGSLIVGFAIGLWRGLRPVGVLWGPLVIAVSGVGLLGAGVFATDPANGFPPGTPLIPLQRTTAGVLHDLFGAIFIFGVPIAAIVFAWTFGRLGERTWMLISLVSGVAVFALVVVGRMTLSTAGLFGLQQRIGITISLVWLTLLAVRMLGAPPASRGESRA